MVMDVWHTITRLFVYISMHMKYKISTEIQYANALMGFIARACVIKTVLQSPVFSNHHYKDRLSSVFRDPSLCPLKLVVVVVVVVFGVVVTCRFVKHRRWKACCCCCNWNFQRSFLGNKRKQQQSQHTADVIIAWIVSMASYTVSLFKKLWESPVGIVCVIANLCVCVCAQLEFLAYRILFSIRV